MKLLLEGIKCENFFPSYQLEEMKIQVRVMVISFEDWFILAKNIAKSKFENIQHIFDYFLGTYIYFSLIFTLKSVSEKECFICILPAYRI